MGTRASRRLRGRVPGHTVAVTSRGTAVVTGASSGIGAATARALADVGFAVVAAARRTDRLRELADEIGGRAVTVDVTRPSDVAALADSLDDVAVLVNCAGGALGVDPVAAADAADWARMYEVNVLGTQRMIRALLPALESGAGGSVVNIGSTAGHAAYAGGGGYCGAKAALSSLTRSLRLELVGRPVRVTEIAPGMVATPEFSLNRFGGDRARADAVYAGVDDPLSAEDVAACVAFAVTLPAHVDVDLLVVRPVAQADQVTVARHPIAAQHPIGANQ